MIPPVGGVGGGLSLAPESLTQASPAGAAEGLAGGAQPAGGAEPSSGFGGELTEAISSLEKTQQSSDSASQALATGTVSDPESAIVTVEDAQMAMQLASQIRTKAAEAVQSVFQTQV